MRFLVPALAALLAAALAPPAAATGAPPGLCYNYLYVADYQWHYVCVDPRGGTCAVYTYRSNGVWSSEPDCVVDAPRTAGGDGCVFLAQDLDYRHYLCVNLTDPQCAVYAKRVSGGHETRTCIAGGGLAAAEPEATCIPTSGGLDYHSFLCIDAGNPRCPVYTLHSTDRGTVKSCYPPGLG